ncbi:lantibiotic dehydratase [Anoxybacteroides amylolyticum]|uniref:Uncharacterized protein n=1 Tax=Anoxybacteroides amylolyticum TaxID=294699 RepID=A0A160F7P7_9BACL|nr:lantibiotic dehydratase [Anoxybacillus amylolyticus]ANB62155.1 hypothetical protein GFC30_2988 [Anoxybacillus amylolyticus]
MSGIPTVSNFLLARLAVNSTEILDHMICHQTGNVIREFLRVENELLQLKQPMIDLLYNVVPSLEDQKKLIRFAIKLKRDIFNDRNDRLQKIKEYDYLLLSKYLNEEENTILNTWLRLYKERKELADKLRQIFNDEKKTITNCLIEYLKSEESREFQKGLALASPDLLKILPSALNDLADFGSNLSKSIYMYLQRSTIKISPFSTLTQISTANFEPLETANGLDSEFDARYLIRMNRAIVTTLIEEMSKHEILSKYFKFRLATSADAGGKKARITGKYMYTNNFFWKTEETKILLSSPILSVLDQFDEGTEYTLEQILSPLGPNKEYAKYLIFSMKLIKPVVPFDIYEEEPLKKIADLIISSGNGDELVHQVSKHLCHANSLFKELKTDCTGLQRVKKLDELSMELKSVFCLLKRNPPQWMENANLVYEDVRSQIEVPYLGQQVYGDVHKIIEMIQPYFHFSSLYSELVDYFKNTYGSGKTTMLVDFLATLTSNEQLLYRMFERAISRDFQKQKNKIVKGPNVAPPTACIYFQLSANSQEDLLNGNYLIVVNKISTGLGNVFSRFNPLFKKHPYSNYLKEWIEGLFPLSEPIELPMGGDWSNLQECFGVLTRNIDWFGECKYGFSHYQIKNISISHCQATDSLVLRAQDGNTISPVYLGTVPQYLIQGPGKILLTLINPWMIDTPYGINPRPWEKVNRVNEIQYIPRQQQGRIVLKRAQWIIPIKLLPPFGKYDGDVEIMLKLQRFIDKYQIPTEVFLTQAEGTVSKNPLKPIWIHFHNPYSIEVLKRHVTQDIEYIVLTEALPNHRTCWMKNKSGKPIISEFMCLGKLTDHT